MSQETSPPQETVQVPIKEEPKPATPAQPPLQGLLDSLKSMQEDIGQICELTSEEKTLVAEFYAALLKIMQPLAATMPVSTGAILTESKDVVQANVDPYGHLIILYRDGLIELKNLTEEKHRDLMISVFEDTLPKFKQLIGAHRRKIENRIKFLSSVTKEMQKISKALSASASQEPQR